LFKFTAHCLLFIVALCTLAGCASESSLSLLVPEQPILLDDVPYYPQEEFHCGPASLAMLLGASGVSASPDELAPYVYLPERQGSLQVELIAASRRWKRIPYVISPSIASVVGELEAGRPVLVLQNLGLNILPVYHYSVVIGILPSGEIVLRSGENEKLLVDLDKFTRSWEKAGSWGIVALKAGELPFQPEKTHYLRAVRDLELAGHLQEAELGYTAALSRWPGDRSALFILGNNQIALKEYKEAEGIFRELVLNDSGDIAALNNLAETLSLQGCPAIALSYIDEGIVFAMRAESELLGTLQKTRFEILKRNSSRSSGMARDCNM